MDKKLTSIPRITNPNPENNTIEWAIPEQVSVAFTEIDKFGYTFMAKVKAEKKHWWSRSWQTFVVHDPSQSTAFAKGLEMLESRGYTINQNTLHFEE